MLTAIMLFHITTVILVRRNAIEDIVAVVPFTETVVAFIVAVVVVAAVALYVNNDINI